MVFRMKRLCRLRTTRRQETRDDFENLAYRMIKGSTEQLEPASEEQFRSGAVEPDGWSSPKAVHAQVLLSVDPPALPCLAGGSHTIHNDRSAVYLEGSPWQATSYSRQMS